MKRRAIAATVFGLALVALSALPRGLRSQALFIDLDVVVVDEDGRPVEGLRQEDFQVKEDGRPVQVLTLDEVRAAENGRSMIVVLDDIGVAQGGTLTMQGIAREFLIRSGHADRLSFVRLSHPDDEPFGRTEEALARIAEYVAGSRPYAGRESVENWLKLVAKLSRQLEPIDGRKVIVGVGAPAMLDFIEPTDRANSLLWSSWTDALAAAARANVAVYVIDPSGASGRGRLRADGLVDKTGGAQFRINDFVRACEHIWREAGHYYVLSYVPDATARELHSIEVKVSRRNVQVRARRARGE
jgi:VWFA-related protein